MSTGRLRRCRRRPRSRRPGGRQEPAALGERLRVREDSADRLRGRRRDREEPVPDRQDLLPDDLQRGVAQEVVRLVDRAGRRVLDREEGVARRPPSASFRAAANVGSRRTPSPCRAEVLARRLVAVRARRALERHAVRVLAARSFESLRSRRVSSWTFRDIAMTSRKISLVRNGSSPSSRAVSSTFLRRAASRPASLRNGAPAALQPADLGSKVQPLPQRPEEGAVGLVDSSSQVVERVHVRTADVTGSAPGGPVGRADLLFSAVRSSAVGVAQSVERRIVVPNVAGSSPVFHPSFSRLGCARSSAG